MRTGIGADAEPGCGLPATGVRTFPDAAGQLEQPTCSCSPQKEPYMARVVVGIDGSDHSQRALRWAHEEAKLRAASLRVIYAWRLPTYAAGYGFAPGDLVDPKVMSDSANEQLDNAVTEIVGDSTDVQVERKAIEGMAAQVLVEEAEGADLLVVGSRGHGGFAGLLLGSVSQQCAQHATCPVVIIRDNRPEA
jgi:nucleotide-binding universal stress UspA family protein